MSPRPSPVTAPRPSTLGVPLAIPKRSGRRAVEQAIAVLRDRVTDNVSLHELARDTGGLSPTYLLRRFRRTTGLTPRQYVLHLRVDRACVLLREGMAPTQVAVEVGFCDQSHLTRYFRRFLGMTPGAFARAEAQAGDASTSSVAGPRGPRVHAESE